MVTVGAVLAQAAQLDGKGAGMIEMAGLAQKGGAVMIHLRLAETPEDISAIRVAVGEADAVIGGDLVVSAGAKTLGLMATGRTKAVINRHEIITGDFTRDTEFRIPVSDLEVSLQARLKDGLALFDATDLAAKLMGDSIYSNMMVLGAAWQNGLLPLSHEAIMGAIELNGAAVDRNKQAFDLGRWAVLNPEEAARVGQEARDAANAGGSIAFRERHLVDYQGKRLAKRYRKLVDGIEDAGLREAVALGYHKLLAYKDEYEVARLHLETEAKAREVFEGDLKLTYHLAPPLLPGKDNAGRPKKRAFGAWVGTVYALLARLRWLRGTPLDVFGYSAERRMERALIRQYEDDMTEVLSNVTPQTHDIAVEIASPAPDPGLWPGQGGECQGGGQATGGAFACVQGRGRLFGNGCRISRPSMPRCCALLVFLPVVRPRVGLQKRR